MDDETAQILPGYALLPASITVDDLRSAIAHSGYPFQGSVTNKLWESFDGIERYPTVQEEWAYLDSETNQVRSIDIFVELSLSKRTRLPAPKVQPYVNILAECKQSELPYIFFLRGQPPSQLNVFPEVGGLSDTNITLFSEIDEASGLIPYSMDVHDVLAFWDLPFFSAPCPLAISVAKAARKGKGIELTGEEAYRSLTLPLMKAADHLKRLSQPQGGAETFAFRLIICVAVVRSPMFGVFRREHREVVDALPWVRVCRLEPLPSLPFRTTSGVRYYDVVHEDHLSEYMTILLRDSRILSSRIEKAADVIAAGRGISQLADEVTYNTLRTVTPEDQIPDDLEPKIRIARIAPGFSIPCEAGDES
jgi:hypothetical protein